MTNAYSYATLSQVKSKGWLNITTTDYDTDILRILEDSSVEADNLCRRQFQPIEGVRYFNGAGGTLMMPLDILSISAFALDDDGSGNFATSLTASDYVLNPTYTYPKTYIKIAYNSKVASFSTAVPNGIKITGVFGYGDGKSATPYRLSTTTVNTGNITNSETTHALATGKGALFSAGMTLRIDTEQLYVTAVATDTLTFVRACNGTTAAAHASGALIYICTYPGPIVEATLWIASQDWKSRESPASLTIGNPISGTTNIDEVLPGRLAKKLEYYTRLIV
jgi:hypothetical protein